MFRAFADAIRDRGDWSISTDVALGIFSFSKVVLWRDLADHAGEFMRQPLVAHLAGGEGIFDDHVAVFPQEEVERHIRPDRLYCPMSADSSQLAAVLYSELGKSFVLHGPPGTGKSQTITNIIAHNLALGRRVLFVSEKKAALDVVYKRLSLCGLAPFCLELHSSKADKLNVVRQFAEALEVGPGRQPAHRADICAGVMTAVGEIGAYAAGLHRPCANGMSAFDCVARRMAKHPQADASLVSFDAAAASHDDIAAATEVVRAAADEWRAVDRESYAALGCVRTAAWSPEFEEKVRRQAEAFVAALSEGGSFMRASKTLWQALKAAVQGTVRYPLRGGFGADQLERMRNLLGHLGGLRLAMAYRGVRQRAEKAKCRAFVEAMEGGRFDSADAVRVFEDSCAEKTLNAIISRSPALSGFSSAKHEERIARFRELDRKWTDAAQKSAVAILSKRLYAVQHPPKVKGPNGRMVEPPIDPELRRELAVLKRECEKKKRVMPLRRLFAETPRLSRLLKPCFLMSPLSVAQYLPAAAEQFDLVVFDEASQMTTWDAVGVIARGRQLIVVGDPKQLPPTNFFTKGDVKDGDEGDDDGSTEDLESVLDECLANGLSSAYLDWHYRSRHEALIAFSNHNYYGDRLNTFPAANGRGGSLGMSFRHVDGGVFDHRSHTNRKEAEAVVDYLFERLADADERKRSWGIVTFSVAQQRLIEDLVDERAKGLPWAAEFFDDAKPDAFFVKNLENVQGDERDVVMFSVAYAPDAQGRFAMSFGPVNRPGGERRLNVAITRAREQVVLFASVHGADICAERTNSVGVRHLKALMDYAESGRLEGDAPSGSAPAPTGVLKAACDLLSANGYEFDIGVGRSSQPVDIAVRDPRCRDRYALGIECDGGAYARQRTVRDRDVLRPDVLAGLGWRLVRLWSMDWAFDRKGAERRLLDAVREACGQS